MTQQQIEQIAKVCHAANKALCDANGDTSQKQWDEAEQWQRDSAIKGVQFRLDNPNATPEEQHGAWMKAKLEDGWKLGDVKDAEQKTHPNLKPYDQLPDVDKKKDYLFQGVVDALK